MFWNFRLVEDWLVIGITISNPIPILCNQKFNASKLEVISFCQEGQEELSTSSQFFQVSLSLTRRGSR